MRDSLKGEGAGRRATVADVAEKARVSVATVDRIMSGRAHVKAATAARVLAAAEALQFYALPSIRNRLSLDTPAIRLGFLLQQSNRTLYRTIAEALRLAASESATPVTIVVEHMDDLSPEAVSDCILRLGRRVQALAVVCAEHPRVTQAIETLAAASVSTYGLISELTAPTGVGYFGLNNWRVGRTAAWAITGLCMSPGRVGVLVGNHRYRCQELSESGFRSYFREHAAQFTLLEPVQTFEDRAIARDVTEQMLRREPDMVGLYISGGGVVGMLEALKASGRGASIITVAHDLTIHTRMGLIDRDLAMVVAHPIARMAADAIAQMSHDVRLRAPPGRRVLDFEIYTPENV